MQIVVRKWRLLLEGSLDSTNTQFLITYMFTLTDAVPFLNSHFGTTSGIRTVYFDEVQCTGSETNLTDCPQSSSISCSFVDSYAGVRCQGLGK